MGKIIKLRDARNREQIQFLCVSLVLILLRQSPTGEPTKPQPALVLNKNENCQDFNAIKTKTDRKLTITGSGIFFPPLVKTENSVLSYGLSASLRSTARPRTTSIKKWLYFTYESRGTRKSFTLFITVKTITKLYLGHSDKFEIEI